MNKTCARRQFLQTSVGAAGNSLLRRAAPGFGGFAGITGARSASAPAAVEAFALMRQPGVVAAFRHALAPGTFDPPEFRLGQCSTQRNLSAEGRAQAQRIGQWFERQALKPARVRSSPWCRCVDTAQLAFGQQLAAIETWAALGSPRGSPEAGYAGQLQALRLELLALRQRGAPFEVWVTHMFVLADLMPASQRQGTASGDAVLLRAGDDGQLQLLAHLAVS